MSNPVQLPLASLMEGMPALSLLLIGTRALAEAATILSRRSRSHGETCFLQAYQWAAEQARVYRSTAYPYLKPCNSAYRDLQEATEMGACGIAIVIARELIGYSIIERSVKGTGFDYWLGAIQIRRTAG